MTIRIPDGAEKTVGVSSVDGNRWFIEEVDGKKLDANNELPAGRDPLALIIQC